MHVNSRYHVGNMDNMLTANQVAQILGVVPITINRWLKSGAFPHHRRFGGDDMGTGSRLCIPKTDVRDVAHRKMIEHRAKMEAFAKIVSELSELNEPDITTDQIEIFSDSQPPPECSGGAII